MSNIYERIGEALLSNGEHDIIRAENKHEEDTLTKAGFTKVGSIKEGGNIVALFKIEQKTKEVVKIVEVPKTTWPYNDQSHPFRKPDPGIWYHNNHWMNNDPNKPLYTYLSGSGNADWAMRDLNKTISASEGTFKGTLSTRLDASYDPLSVLSDYTFNTVLPKN